MPDQVLNLKTPRERSDQPRIGLELRPRQVVVADVFDTDGATVEADDVAGHQRFWHQLIRCAVSINYNYALVLS